MAAARSDARGIQFPLDDSGKRSTAPVGRRILAAALRVLDAGAAERCLAERDWRHRLPAAPAPAGRTAGGQATGHRGLVPCRARCRLARTGLPARRPAAGAARGHGHARRRGAADTAPARHAGQRAGALGSALQGPAPERRRTGAAHRRLGRGRRDRAVQRAGAAPGAMPSRMVRPVGPPPGAARCGQRGRSSGLAGAVAGQHRGHRPGPRTHLEEDRAASACRQRPADRAGGGFGFAGRRCRAGRAAGRLRHADADAGDRRLAAAA